MRIDMNKGNVQQEDTVSCGLNVMQRELLQSKLRQLDDTPPPREVWQRIEQQARAEGLVRSRWSEGTRWLAGSGLAAAVVLAVLNVPVADLLRDGNENFQTVPEFAENGDTLGAQHLNTMNALMVQSQRIESDLRALPDEPSLVRAGTAVTISELEDHIAAIDFALNHPDLDLSAEQEAVYWRERVRVMRLVLQLRTAQAQRTSF